MPDAKKKRAAIPADLLDQELGKISAADLVTALNASRTPGLGAILADKKKFELWIEERPLIRVRLRDLLEKLKGEKKKRELEVPFDFGEIVNPPFIDRLADAVAERLQRRG